MATFSASASLLFALHILLLHFATAAKPGYQVFSPNGRNDREFSATKTLSTASSSSTSAGSTWRVKLHHRDTIKEAAAESRQVLMTEERLARDAARAAAIARRVQIAAMGAHPASEWTPLKSSEVSNETTGHPMSAQLAAQDFTSPIVSGLSQGSGEYFTRFGLGTPPKQSYFVMDTGSDLSWTQCFPCASCYKQSDPYFNPSTSSSYQTVTCAASLCSELTVKGCQSNQCLYQVSYGDGSFTVGDFAQETFTFEGNVVREVAIGCGHDNEGLFVGAAGLLGMGAGRLSFPSQIKTPFSYCLADRFLGGSSELIFGEGAAPAGSLFTPLLRNPRLGTFYYLQLEGLSVGGVRLGISPEDFSLSSGGTGGVIIDSGTSITRLVQSAYTALRDAFVAGASNLPRTTSVSLFDTCYALSGVSSVEVPTVDLHFAGGATVPLPAENYLIPVDTSGTFCFGFAGTSSDFSIIGNMQQQGFRVSFDAGGGRLGFAPKQC